MSICNEYSGKLVNVLVANGINPKKIQVTFYEDIKEMELAEKRCIIEEREKELRNFEKMAKINKLVNVLAANGINPKKIQVAFYEDIEETELAKNRRIIEEREKELRNFEKMAKENPEWVDESRYADSNPRTDSNEYDDDDDDYDDF